MPDTRRQRQGPLLTGSKILHFQGELAPRSLKTPNMTENPPRQSVGKNMNKEREREKKKQIKKASYK